MRKKEADTGLNVKTVGISNTSGGEIQMLLKVNVRGDDVSYWPVWLNSEVLIIHPKSKLSNMFDPNRGGPIKSASSFGGLWLICKPLTRKSGPSTSTERGGDCSSIVESGLNRPQTPVAWPQLMCPRFLLSQIHKKKIIYSYLKHIFKSMWDHLNILDYA